jgi:phosphohistidine phosphatase
MPELLLLRHAKSAWDQPGLADHERPLAPRGVKAAKRMGKAMRELGLVPDLAICSTAVRARQTWELALAALGGEVETRYLKGLYLGSPGQMLAVIRRQPVRCRRLLLVAHDPGIHALATSLAGEGEAADLERLRAKFPTGALAQIELSGAGWQEVGMRQGRLLRLIRPKDLG